MGQGPLIHVVSRSHSTKHHPVTSDQLVAQISTCQHITFTTDILAHGGLRTHKLSRRAAADLRLRPSGRCDQHRGDYLDKIRCVNFVTTLWQKNISFKLCSVK